MTFIEFLDKHFTAICWLFVVAALCMPSITIYRRK